MKSLAFALVIVFVLENYGTIHAKPMEEYEPPQQVALFKRYAQNFIDAATKPLLNDRRTVEGLCECIPILEQELGDHPTLVKLAIASIVKDHYRGFRTVLQNPESRISAMMPLNPGLMKNIRTILVVLGKPIETYTPIHLGNHIRNYLSQFRGTSGYGEREQSALRCYRAMHSVRFKCFHELSENGFEILSRLLVSHDKVPDNHPIRKQLWAILDDMTQQIAQCDLRSVRDPDNADEIVRQFQQTLG